MGVKEVKLKELLLVFRNGASIKQFEGAEGLPITRIETISDATINPLKVGYANIFDDKYQDYYLQEGDILLSHINSVTHLGKCAIYTNPIDKLIHGMNLLMLRANRDLVLPKYLYYVLNSKQFKVQLPKITKKSVNQASMTVTDIGNLKLLIEEDLEQQQKIVEILDKADEIRAKKKLANDKLDEFLKSTFISMFGDPVKNEKNLPLKLLKEVFTLSSGNFLPASQRDEHGECPVYGGNGIAGFHNEYMFEHSKLCIGRVGVKCGCIHITKPHSWITDNALYVKEYKTDINEIYLKMLLAIMNLNQYAKQSAQPQISQTTISNLAVIFPPIEDQNRFAQIVEHVEAQKQKNELVIEQMNNLFNSLSQRAFKGEL